MIADRLFISVGTVGYHGGNILNKTTSGNRAAAATYASRIGLTIAGSGPTGAGAVVIGKPLFKKSFQFSLFGPTILARA